MSSEELLVEDLTARESVSTITIKSGAIAQEKETTQQQHATNGTTTSSSSSSSSTPSQLLTATLAQPSRTQRNQRRQQSNNNNKRTICSRCQRPMPNACICESLPVEALVLQRTRILVLQHPHELKRKNRSVPLLQLTLSTDSLIVGVGRRLGDDISSKLIMDIIRDDSEPLVLLYPGPDAIPLQEAMEIISADSKNDSSCREIKNDDDGRSNSKKKINILVLDGTWKYAREMDMKNKLENQYPDRMIRIQLKPTTEDKMPNDTFQPGRFDIRTPPSPDHLSTAECIAWIASRVERQEEEQQQQQQGDSLLLDTLLKPLDCMVSKWKSFQKGKRPAPEDGVHPRQSKQRKHVNIE